MLQGGRGLRRLVVFTGRAHGLHTPFNYSTVTALSHCNRYHASFEFATTLLVSPCLTLDSCFFACLRQSPAGPGVSQSVVLSRHVRLTQHSSDLDPKLQTQTCPCPCSHRCLPRSLRCGPSPTSRQPMSRTVTGRQRRQQQRCTAGWGSPTTAAALAAAVVVAAGAAGQGTGGRGSDHDPPGEH